MNRKPALSERIDHGIRHFLGWLWICAVIGGFLEMVWCYVFAPRH